MQTLGDRVAHLRTRAELSGSELARLSGLARSHVQLIESGARMALQADTLLALATVLGVSLDWLVRGLGEEPSPETIRAAVEVARARRAAATSPGGGEAA